MANNLFQISGLGSGVDTSSILDALRNYKMQPVTILQNKQDQLSAKQSVWQDINSRLLSFKSAADDLTKPNAFSSVKAASSDSSVATVTAGATAAPGMVNLSVTQLAQARKVASNTFSDPAAALGLSGDFAVNGRAVHVTADDTLSSLASKINALGAGATAAVVQIDSGQYRLTVGSTATGLQDSLSLAPLGGGSTSLATLGLLDGSTAPTLRYTTTGPNGTSAASVALASTTATLGAAMGLTSPITGSFTVNGATVSYDTATDTLSSLADKINALGISGLSASVTTAVDANGKGSNRLQITGAAGAPTFGNDGNGFLGLIGMTQGTTTAANVLSQAKNAKFSLDGLVLERPGNTITDAIPGVTLGLQKENSTAALTFTSDTQATVDKIQKFVSLFNDVAGKIRSQSTLADGADPSNAPALLGDATLQQVQDQLMSTVMGVMRDLPPGFQTLQDIGIKMNADNSLAVDTDKLTSALQQDPASVTKMFTQMGTASDPSVSYLTSTGSTQASPAGGYAVQITTAAQQAQVVGGAYATLAQPETLTFGGTLFSSPVDVTLASGNTLAQTIAQINNSAAGKTVTAYDAGGKLGLRSVGYGAGQSFTVASDQASGASGIGTTALTGTGVDVAGTINGETAAGKGQMLTGSQSGGAANGLSIVVTASTPGSYGNISLQRGAAASLSALIAQLTDTTNGMIHLEEDTLQQRIDDSKDTITDMTARVDDYINQMQQQFVNMETKISTLKSQSSQFASQISGLMNQNKNNS